MSYPAYEETKTMDLRWLMKESFWFERVLQQRWIIRDGIGEKAVWTEQWRDVGVAIFGREP